MNNTKEADISQIITPTPSFVSPAPDYQWDLSAVTFEIEQISPEQALIYLKGHVRNRGISQKHFAKLLGIYNRGNWKFNGIPIVFDRDGALADGQHRLWMIAHSAQTVPLLVIRGIDPEGFNTYDLCKRRTLKDILTAGGNISADESVLILASTLAYAAAYAKTGSFICSRAIEDERIDYLDEHPQIRSFAKLYAKPNRLRIPNGLFALCHYLFSAHSPEQAATFMAQIMGGEGVTSQDPAWRFREWVDLKMGKKRGVVVVNTAGQTLIKAWNHYRAGDKLSASLRVPLVPLNIE